MLELLVVLGLISILGGLLLGVGSYAFEAGRVSRARAELAALAAALDAYRAAYGDYPIALETLPGQPALLDPWNHSYRYAYKSQAPWTNPGYVLYSAGPDGLANEALRAGGYPDPVPGVNADNLWANRP